MRKCTVTAASNMSGETYEYLCDRVRRKFGEPLPDQLAKATDLDLLGRLTFAAACADSMSAFQAMAAKELGEAAEGS